MSVRWIPSELNIADEGSRLAEGAKESKLLVDLLGDSWAEEFVAGTYEPRALAKSVAECRKHGGQADTYAGNAERDARASGSKGHGKPKEKAWKAAGTTTRVLPPRVGGGPDDFGEMGSRRG